MHGNMHILNVQILFLLPLVPTGNMPDVPFRRTAVQSLIHPPWLSQLMFLRLVGPYPILRIRPVSFCMACRVHGICRESSRLRITHLLHGFLLLRKLPVVRRTVCGLCCFTRCVHCKISRGISIN